MAGCTGPIERETMSPDDQRGPRAPQRASALATCLGVLLAFLLGLCWSPAGTASERIRVGVYQNAPKVDYLRDGNGRLRAEGIFVDLIEAIARAEGWVIEYVPGTWSEGLARLEAGEIDLMPDVARTAEREQRYAFHQEPALSSWNQVYARRDSGIRSLLDLDGKRVAVLAGSVQQDALLQMVAGFSLNVTPLPEEDYAAAFAAVVDGRAAAVVTNRFFGVRNAQKYGLEDTAIIFSPAQLFFAAPRTGDPERLAAIDRHLVAFKKTSDSVYFTSLRRWSMEEIRPALPTWLPAAAIGLFGLLAGALAWGTVLRRKVAAKTGEIQRLYALEQEHAAELELRVARRTREIENLSAFLQEIIDHIPNAIFYKGPDLRFRGCNVAYERTFGISRRDFIGKSVLDLEYLPPADREAFQNEDAGMLAAGATLSREAVIPFADGRDHHTLYSVSGFHDANGVPVGLVGVIVDITPLKEAEAALREATLRAESADRLKSAFLATMSHELRTPLNSIIGFTGIVLQGLAGPLNDEQQKQLGMVRDSARHLLALINDVLDISKIEAGELKVAREPFDAAASARKVLDIVRPLAEKKGLNLVATLPATPVDMIGDARRVEQILLNLIGNAIKFTEAGEVRLTLELPPGQTDASPEPSTPAIRLRIADTGIGIQPEEMALLFTPFRQIDSALSRKHEGTGLGLAICRRLADLMGGRIEAESRWQEGSTFTVTLPRQAPTQGETP